MIVNIVDHRKRKYRFACVNAIVEAAWHDNSCKDSDQIKGSDVGPDYAEKEHISLVDAIKWGNSFDEAVTLYIYDKDGGIYIVRENGTRSR